MPSLLRSTTIGLHCDHAAGARKSRHNPVRTFTMALHVLRRDAARAAALRSTTSANLAAGGTRCLIGFHENVFHPRRQREKCALAGEDGSLLEEGIDSARDIG